MRSTCTRTVRTCRRSWRSSTRGRDAIEEDRPPRGSGAVQCDGRIRRGRRPRERDRDDRSRHDHRGRSVDPDGRRRRGGWLSGQRSTRRAERRRCRDPRGPGVAALEPARRRHALDVPLSRDRLDGRRYRGAAHRSGLPRSERHGRRCRDSTARPARRHGHPRRRGHLGHQAAQAAGRPARRVLRQGSAFSARPRRGRGLHRARRADLLAPAPPPRGGRARGSAHAGPARAARARSARGAAPSREGEDGRALCATLREPAPVRRGALRHRTRAHEPRAARGDGARGRRSHAVSGDLRDPARGRRGPLPPCHAISGARAQRGARRARHRAAGSDGRGIRDRRAEAAMSARMFGTEVRFDAPWILALPAPSVVHASFDVPAEGIDLVIVLDTSSSMTTPDFGGQSRIEAVKKVVHEFLGGLTNDRAGVVIFSGEALVLSPLTLDYAAAQRLVEPVQAGRPLRDGTAIGTGLATGLNVLRDSTARGKVAVLLTDGQNNAGDIQPMDAAQMAKLIGVRLYTIGAVPAGRPGPRAAPDVDELVMRQMSELTGGQYYRASDETALREVYREIQTLEKARVGTRAFISTEDAAMPFAAAGAALLVLELMLATTVFRRVP